MLTNFWTHEESNGAIQLRLMRQTMLPVLVVGIVLLAAGVYGAWRVHRLHKRGSDILAENVSSIRAAEELETNVLEIRYRLKRFLATENRRHLDEIDQLLPHGRQWYEHAGKFATTAREQQLIERLGQEYEQLITDFTQVHENSHIDEATSIANHLADQVISQRILGTTQAYIALNEKQLAKSNQQNESTANQLMFGLVLLGTCGGVTGLLTGFIIARRVSRTIVQLSVPLRDTAGKLNEVVGPLSLSAGPGFQELESMAQTVSARVATVVERLQANEREVLRAEQLAAVGQLAAGLAHELRNPLTSLKAILQLADTPANLTERDLEVLKQEMQRLEGSVQSFLDFARPPQPEKRLVDLQSMVFEPAELVGRWAERKKIELRYRASEEVLVMADATQIRQVMLNLLMNALDATPIGGQIDIEVLVEGDELPSAVVTITDDGPGLPPELEGRIFDPFVSTKEAGIGLGLSICKRILEAHGGTIHAANCEGRGARFLFCLPVLEEPNRVRELTGAKSADR